jgi:hypothetical protein
MSRVTVVSVACALMLGGCGGDKSDSGDSKAPAETEAAVNTETTAGATGLGAEATMRAYFTALRQGDAKVICALEDETLEMFKYDVSGDAACLADEANQNEQPALPSGDEITIKTKAEQPEAANYVVTDQKGAEIQVQMVRTDGDWLVHIFT